MGLKFFYINEYTHLQITVCMCDYTHITYVKSEKLLILCKVLSLL